MDTIQNRKIGLRIAGTKSRQGGFAPLVAVGLLAGDEGDNMDKITVVAEKPVYIIKHTNDYILYQLIDRKVKPCDRDTVGILSIALTIVRDAQLADGKSPYSLLKEVYKKFVDDYMERSSDGLDSFIDKDIDQSEFASILENYPLESRSTAYIPMNPSGISGILCVPENKIGELFRDSQYQEFAPFKEIEIGLNCMTMPGLEKIEIPRPQIYSVIVNGRDVRHSMSKATDTFDTATYLRDTQDVTYDNISFSLSYLFISPDNRIEKGQSSVMLDIAHKRITCDIYGKKNMYELVIICDGGINNDGQVIKKDIETGAIQLIIGKIVISNKKEIPVSLITQQISVTPNYIPNYGVLTVASLIDDENRKLIVTISLKQRATSGTIITQNNSYSRNAANQPVSEKENQRNNAQIVNNPDTDDDIDSNTNTRKKRWTKKMIFLLVGLVLGMCIGFGTWGIHLVTIGKITHEDSILIYETLKVAAETSQDQVTVETPQVQATTDASQDQVTVETPQVQAITDVSQNQVIGADITNARKEILNFVNEKQLNSCRNHDGWKKNYLTKEEKSAVEAVLDVNKYKGYSAQAKKKIEGLNEGKFATFKEVIEAQKKIWNILDDDKKGR